MIKLSEKVKADFLKNIGDVVDSGIYSLGNKTIAVEEEWGKITDRHCVTTTSGTTALELIANIMFSSCMSTGNVIIPVVTVPMVKWAFNTVGFRTIFSDIDPYYGCSGLKEIRECYECYGDNYDISAVVVVHNGGVIHPDIEKIVEFCKEKDLFLIEDCSHAHGCKYNDKLAGTFGTFSAWSFYPTKVLIGSEGGIASFNSKEFAEISKCYANQSKVRGSGSFGEDGYNLRLSELSAALMLAEINNRKEMYFDRRNMLFLYHKNLDRRIIQFDDVHLYSTCYKYTVLCNDKKEKNYFLRKFKESGIPASGATYDFELDLDFDGAGKWIDIHLNLPFERFASDERKRETADKVKNILRG